MPGTMPRAARRVLRPSPAPFDAPDRYGSALPFPAPRCIPQRLLSSSDLDRPLLSPRYSASSGGIRFFSRDLFSVCDFHSLDSQPSGVPTLFWSGNAPIRPSRFLCTTVRPNDCGPSTRTERHAVTRDTAHDHIIWCVPPPSRGSSVTSVSSFGRKVGGLVGAQSSSDEAGCA